MRPSLLVPFPPFIIPFLLQFSSPGFHAPLEDSLAMKIRSKKAKNPPNPIGILSFEVANAMSRAVHLHRSLSNANVSNLFTKTLNSPSIRSLISQNDSFLLSLILFEKLDDLNRIADVASRLGRRHCSHPALVGFEHVYSDLLSGRIQNPTSLTFVCAEKSVDAAVRKMEKLVASTAALYAELEVLSGLENSAKRFGNLDETRKVLEEKIQWQRQDVEGIRESSLWNQSFDKAVMLLARAVCTVHARIRVVFGECVLGVESCLDSDGLGKIPRGRSTGVNFRLHCAANPGRFLFNCLNLGSSDVDCAESESAVVTFSSATEVSKCGFGPKSRLTMLAQPSTIGGSCLALHYANVIIVIEKLMMYPHLVGEEAGDDLYQMLPSSLRLALRKSLKSYVRNLAIYDTSLAHDWKETMGRIFGWLGPMAHNMIRWQTERNFEQQQIVLKESVLLIQTLYFADREKTEAAICELLVGLNYICRYEQQQNALMDCTSSVDFDDCMDWQQMQFDSAAERL